MTTCNLCFGQHDNTWEKDPTQPHMYCTPCQKIRKDAKGTVTHVIGSLYLGDLLAASKFDGGTLCVHENPLFAVKHQIAILKKLPNSMLDRTGALIDTDKMGNCIEFIQDYELNGKPLLVHCKAGVERSPLVMATYLWVDQRFDTLEKAYMYLIRRRPTVSDRSFWMPKNFNTTPVITY